MRLRYIIPALYLACACGDKDKPAKQEDKIERAAISNADVEYYPVNGNNCEEAKEGMTGYTVDGQWVAGKTDAEIKFECSYNPTPEQNDGQTKEYCCKAVIDNLTTSCNATVYLPQWAGSDKCWDKFINALTVHEQGHVDICQDYKGKLKSAVEGLESRMCSVESMQKACDDALDDLEQKANSEYGRVSTEHDNAQDAYDTSTDHGRGAEQNAVLNCDCE